MSISTSLTVLTWRFLLDVISTRLTMKQDHQPNYILIDSCDSRFDPCPVQMGVPDSNHLWCGEKQWCCENGWCQWRSARWSLWDTFAWRRTFQKSNQFTLVSTARSMQTSNTNQQPSSCHQFTFSSGIRVAKWVLTWTWEFRYCILLFSFYLHHSVFISILLVSLWYTYLSSHQHLFKTIIKCSHITRVKETVITPTQCAYPQLPGSVWATSRVMLRRRCKSGSTYLICWYAYCWSQCANIHHSLLSFGSMDPNFHRHALVWT